MIRKDLDPALGRIERDTVLACGVFAAIAWLGSGAPAAAVGVLSGGLLMGASYWTIKNAVDRLAGVAARGESPASHRERRGARLTRREEGKYREYLTDEQRRAAGHLGGQMQRDLHHGLLGAPAGEAPPGPTRVSVGVVLRVVGRYALLAGVAYVMIVRLRLHPLSLLVGVSTIVVGIALEGLRMLTGRRASP